ncbi:S1C family serine protease [Actinokineospora pegani]|uniref:S1C family serine protease n=1 Tax=Actinokineospora pegani TaxID=2654637 RepID=UPI0012EA199E|nr:trypsin-like peptidase domain-containing protein [Actinokineospora pegani]
MTQQNTDPAAGQRIGPRPLDRPSVDPAAASVFGRPSGVAGAFSPQSAGRPALNELPTAPPAPQTLAEAFGRTPADGDVRLQRPPGSRPGAGAPGDEHLWSEDSDPWRDPSAGAVIGPPALAEDAEEDSAEERGKGARLSLPEVLFGRRVKPVALALLGVIALVVGAAGGVVGWAIARAGSGLTSDVTLAQVDAGIERDPQSVSGLAARVRPGVVSIETIGERGSGVGSGLVIDGAGYVLTNWHVVTGKGSIEEGSAKIMTVFNDGTRTEARIVGTDAKTDLAVIKVNVTNPTVLQFGDSDKLQVGDPVIAVGSPLGLSDTVTEGIVSALHRPIVAGSGNPPIAYDAIQTDASINEGNSGGPLISSNGSVIGINSSIRPAEGSTGSVGLGFAIPGNDAKRIAESLIRDGQVKHADIGANVRSVSAETAEGAQVVNVTEGGPAAAAGIAEGDVVRKVGDRAIRNAAELTVAVRMNNPGDTVPVVLARQGRELTVQVTLRSD